MVKTMVPSADYTVGWITLAMINAGLAQSKSRSGGNWFLLSLLLGPIATFIIVTNDPPSKPPQPRSHA